MFALLMVIAELLENRTVEGFEIREHYFCSLKISEGYSVSLQSLLRYVGKGDVFITSTDHMHQFGLPEPFDAEKEIRARVVGKVIRHVEIDSNTGDLTLCFDDGRIEIICTSAGYEAYQVYGPNNLIVIGRGGCASSRPHSTLPLIDANRRM